MKWNTKQFRLLTVPAWIALFALAFACSSDSPSAPRNDPPPPPGSGGGAATFNVTVSANPATLTAGSTDPAEIRVSARDRNSGAPPANGTTIVISANLGEFGNLGSGTRQLVVNLVNGDALLQYFAPAQAGTAVIQAELQGVVGQASITVREAATFFLSLVDPATGSPSGGDRVTIRGGGFERPLRVTFGGAIANVLSSAGNRIVVETPAAPSSVGAGQTLPVTVSVTVRVNESDQATDSLGGAFTYVSGGGGIDRPVVLSVDPSAGPNEGGTRVTLTGEGFVVPVQVLFGSGSTDNFTGVEATIQSVTTSRIVVLSPAAAGFGVDNRNRTVGILVRNTDSGFATVAQAAFRYGTPIRISGISPLEGPAAGGTQVRIFGSGFEDPLQVTIGNLGNEIEQTVLSVAPDEILFRTTGVTVNSCPANGIALSAPVNVRLLDAGAPNNDTLVSSDQDFRYVLPIPQIVGVSPTAGGQNGNLEVVITGSGFVAPVRVTFSEKGETFVGDVISVTPTSIRVRTPAVTDVAFDQITCDDNNDGQQGTKLIPTAFDIVVDNLQTGCSSGATGFPNGFTYQPSNPTCINDVAPVPPPQCSDGIDNDGDTFVDLADSGCSGPLDNDEVAQCADGIDNDGDTFIDLADPECVDAFDNNESA